MCRRTPRAPRFEPPNCPSFSSPECSSSRLLLQLERAAAFNPFARRILDNLSQSDVGFGDLGDLPVVLPEVITNLHLVQEIVDSQQGVRTPLLDDAAYHAHAI